MNRELKNLLTFGYGLALILSFVGGRWLFKLGELTASAGVCLAIALFMVVITVLRLPLLKVIYTYWMKAAMKIGHGVTLIIMAFLFYVVFGFVGILMRILRKDLLDQAIDHQAKTYWQPRTLVKFDKVRYTKQF